ncbi:sigma-70 family RNA polymerase sigma factor [Marinilabiliaceae bacterium JC017]|nr:sigma-70 family RNA polymerase sigma factor [Marinilabiliaceae bacterium JC017]
MRKVRYSDKQLIEGIYNRDSKVIRYIMDVVWVPVKDFIYKNSGNKQDAIQIIEEGILAIYTKSDKLELTSSFTTYFFAICKNMWLNELRKRKKSPVLTSEFGNLLQENEIAEKQLYEKRRLLYLKYFQKISKVCQSLLRLMAKGFSNEEIMAELAFSSIQYTKNRKSMCNTKLIELIKEDPQYKDLKYGL